MKPTATIGRRSATGINNNRQSSIIDLSGLGVLEADSYQFRIQSIANERASNPAQTIDAGGTWRIGDILQDSQFGLFRFEGLVTPEPSRTLLLSIAGLLLIARRRR